MQQCTVSLALDSMSSSHHDITLCPAWLNIAQCIEYKIALMTFGFIHGMSSACFHSIYLPVDSVSGRPMLRSAIEPHRKGNAAVHEVYMLLHQLFETVYQNTCISMRLAMHILFMYWRRFCLCGTLANVCLKVNFLLYLFASTQRCC